MSDELKPSVGELERMFDLDSMAGILRRKPYRHRGPAGEKVGSIDGKGRLRTEISGRTFGVHQIVFALTHGRWPNGQVDHINGDKLDNRPENLREATNAENSRNRAHKHSKSGFKGVTLHKRQGKYNARIMINGKMVHLGCYDNPQVAAHAYNKAAIQYHGDFALLNPVGEDYGRTS